MAPNHNHNHCQQYAMQSTWRHHVALLDIIQFHYCNTAVLRGMDWWCFPSDYFLVNTASLLFLFSASDDRRYHCAFVGVLQGGKYHLARV